MQYIPGWIRVVTLDDIARQAVFVYLHVASWRDRYGMNRLIADCSTVSVRRLFMLST
jgi:hypothetical protein